MFLISMVFISGATYYGLQKQDSTALALIGLTFALLLVGAAIEHQFKLLVAAREQSIPSTRDSE